MAHNDAPGTGRPVVVAAARLLAEMGQCALQQAGFETATVTSFEELDALDGAALVVLDASVDDAFALAASLTGRGIPVVAVTRTAISDHLTRFLQVGVLGYVTASSGVADLVSAVTAALAGESFLDEAATCALVKLTRDGGEATLSAREREVLRLVAEGCSNTQIAERLGVSFQTVKTHLARVFRKLDCADRAAALYKALQLGLLD